MKFIEIRFDRLLIKRLKLGENLEQTLRYALEIITLTGNRLFNGSFVVEIEGSLEQTGEKILERLQSLVKNRNKITINLVPVIMKDKKEGNQLVQNVQRVVLVGAFPYYV